MESFALLGLLVLPIVMLVVATRLRKAREIALDATGAPRPVSSTSKPWDRGMRNAMLVGLTGALLGLAGLYAYAVAAGTRLAPLFGLPVVLGVVLLSASYRRWMRAVAQIPDEPPQA